MAFHEVKKVVIITEKLLTDQVCEIIEESRASGYTMSNVAGKGSRNIRSNADGANLVGDFSNVKIEVIVKDEETAQKLIEKINDEFFDSYSGIAFIETVEILRLAKFTPS